MMQLSKIATQNGNIYDFIYMSGCILCNKMHIIHTYTYLYVGYALLHYDSGNLNLLQVTVLFLSLTLSHTHTY